jgi:hypothetical protein
MPEDQPKTERPLRPVLDFIWKSALGAIVGVVVLVLLRKYA